nr:unnamed protein product [Callosobruchus chinensis]
MEKFNRTREDTCPFNENSELYPELWNVHRYCRIQRQNQKAECITKIGRLIQYFCSGNSKEAT